MSTTQEQTTIVNGVDLEALGATIEVVKGDASIASFTFRAANQWLDGGRNRSTIKDFYGAGQEQLRPAPLVHDADEPPVLLGTDTDANPVEYVLHALAGCLTTSLVYHAAARGIAVRRVESTFEGDLDLRGFLGLDDRVRNGYREIRVAMKVDVDGGQEQAEELVRLAQSRSPVYDIIKNGVPVSVTASVP